MIPNTTIKLFETSLNDEVKSLCTKKYAKNIDTKFPNHENMYKMLSITLYFSEKVFTNNFDFNLLYFSNVIFDILFII